MLALLLLSLLQADDRKVDVENTKVLVFDSAKGMTFRIRNDGKVELTLKEEDKETGKKSAKTTTAANQISPMIGSKLVGSKDRSETDNNAPPSAARPAETANAHTRSRRTFTPHASAPRSSSRAACKDRPSRPR